MERAERTRARSAGAGIAVHAGNAEVFGRTRIDLTVEKAFYVGVIQQRRIALDNTPFGRDMVDEPIFDFCKKFLHRIL